MVKVREDHPQLDDGSVDIAEWSARMADRYEGLDPAALVEACRFAKKAQDDAIADENIWADGASSFLTGLEMAEILSDLRLDQHTLIAAIVYRAVREHKTTLDAVKGRFGKEVSGLVKGVLRMAAISTARTDIDKPVLGELNAQADKVRKMLVALVNDVRVALIKLSERTCAIRAVKDFPGRRERVAREISHIYAPLAHRLGIGHIKWELEDLAFRYLEPDAYKRIAKLLDERRVDRQNFITEVVATLESKLAEVNIAGDVFGRAKHIYSIWRKMQRKNIGFSQVYDIRAVRILVPEIHHCYAVLGIVHTLWRNIPNEFDDYIANPKQNGYRSLHTAVIGPHNKVLEVQIRSFDMHQEAEFGVCAHWQYKGTDSSVQKADSYEEKIEWLRQVLDWHEEMGGNVVEHINADFDQDRIYVFTPDGHVVDLVQGSTPLDFAYHIHTEVGHRCRGGKVNGKIVPLTHQLHTGDRVEILTAKEGGPSRDWLRPSMGYLHSSSTRAKVQQWFKQQDKQDNISTGRALLEREFKRLALTSLDYKAIAANLNFQQVDDMYAAVGAGDINPGQVLRTAQAIIAAYEPTPEPEIPPQPQVPAPKTESDIHVEGVGKLLTQIARCCKPVPGDDISGYITQGRGVSIHRQDCKQLQRLLEADDRRVIEVRWGENLGEKYPVDIRIEAYDRHGIIRDVTMLMASSKVNVLGMSTNTDQRTNIASLYLTIEIVSMEALLRLFGRISQLPNIISVEREASPK